jgi:hypothetical protein
MRDGPPFRGGCRKNPRRPHCVRSKGGVKKPEDHRSAASRSALPRRSGCLLWPSQRMPPRFSQRALCDTLRAKEVRSQHARSAPPLPKAGVIRSPRLACAGTPERKRRAGAARLSRQRSPSACRRHGESWPAPSGRAIRNHDGPTRAPYRVDAQGDRMLGRDGWRRLRDWKAADVSGREVPRTPL